MDTARRRVRIRNPLGLHLRMASRLASIASYSDSGIQIHSSGGSADPVSIFELMILGAAGGDWVTVSVCGPADAEVLDLICVYLETYVDGSADHIEIESPDTDSFAA